MTHQESIKDYHCVQRESQTQARGTVNVPQSTAASAAGVHVRAANGDLETRGPAEAEKIKSFRC